MANLVFKIGSDSDVKYDNSDNSIYRDIAIKSSKNLQRGYSVDKLTDVNAVTNSLNNVFAWIPGERILNPEFGSNLKKLLFDGITQFNAEVIQAEIQNCVSQWEPRVKINRVINVSTKNDTENNTVVLRISYSIPSLTGSQIYAYDFYSTKR